MYLVEITAITNNLGASTVLRYATEAFITNPSDSPANTGYEGRIKDVGLMSRTLFSDLKTGGQTQVGRGDLVLSNADGALDSIAAYGFDGQTIILKYAESSTVAYSSLTTLFTATVASVEFSIMAVTFKLRDPLEQLNKPLLTTKYLGNNVLPDGLEGVEGDLKDKVKPRIYGKVLNISPPLINTSKLIYQVSDSAINTLDAAYDKGVALTAGANYTTLADVSATAPSAGQYRCYPAGGLFRLGSSPSGSITCDVTQGAASSNRTAAQILKQIALDAGIASGDIASADVAALDAANSAVLGIYIDSDATVLSAMDQIAQSIGVWYGFDIAGKLRIGQFKAPSGSPTYAITYLDMVDIERLSSNDDKKGTPIYRATLNYQKYYTTQNPADLAGSVTDDRKSLLKKEYRTVTAEDTSIQIQHKLAPELKRDTLLTVKSDADNEASRALTLFKASRETYKVTIINNTDTASIDIGQIVSLVYSRFGLSSGKLFLVIGIEADYHKHRKILTLWG